ncbi:uncharacterized protein [Palaemon carinicauda]|uniref:uncharacterized protein n=1 Tax=Palaemon carinicauda TaxID=392227 RepID=UPI0035B6957C
MKENIVGVEWKSERLMKVRLCFGGLILSVLSTYAQQTRCNEKADNNFRRDMDEAKTAPEIEERLVSGGNANRHIGGNHEHVSRIHGGHGMGEMNQEGELITDPVDLGNQIFNKVRKACAMLRPLAPPKPI